MCTHIEFLKVPVHIGSFEPDSVSSEILGDGSLISAGDRVLGVLGGNCLKMS
jgi:hypothetical protein